MISTRVEICSYMHATHLYLCRPMSTLALWNPALGDLLYLLGGVTSEMMSMQSYTEDPIDFNCPLWSSIFFL